MGLITFNIGTLPIGWYYAFCGTATSLVLLIVWFRAPQLDERFSVDNIENSLWAVMTISIVVGIFFLEQTGLEFYSVPVFAVFSIIPVYLCLAAYLRPNMFTLIAAQASSILVIATGLITFNIVSMPIQWIYVFCGVVISIALLIAWIFAPQLDERFVVKDIENSLWMVMFTSFVLGLLVLFVSPSFFIINGLILLISGLVYLCLVMVIHPYNFVILSAQLLSLLALAYGLLSYNIALLTSLYIIVGFGLILQAGLTSILPRYQPNTVPLSEFITLAMLSIIYPIAWFLAITTSMASAIPIGIILLIFASYYAYHIDEHIMWVYLGMLPYIFISQVLSEFTTDTLWLMPFFILSLVQVATIRLSERRKMVESFVYIGLIAMGIIGYLSLNRLSNWNPTTTFEIVYPFATLLTYCAVMLADDAREQSILNQFMPYILGAVSILYYGFVLATELKFPMLLIGFAVSISIVFWIVQHVTHNKWLYFPIFFAPYIALFHILDVMIASFETLILANTILSLIIYFANFLPDETRLSRHIIAILVTVAMTGIGFFVGLLGDTAPLVSLNYAGWISGYSALLMLWLIRDTYNKPTFEGIIAIGGLLIYFWHILYLADTADAIIFGNIQWYLAAFVTFLFTIGITLLRDNEESDIAIPIIAGTSILLIVPTLWQIFSEQLLIYFLLGIIYSLVIVGIAITFSQSRLRTFGSLMLVFVVLLQSREFLFGLPRWLIVGVVGFGLLSVGLYLSLRRRDVKKNPKGIEDTP